MLLTVALIIISCNRPSVYSHFQAIDNAGWMLTDTLHFAVPADSSTPAGTATLQLNLRSTNRYPFTDITIIAEQHNSSSRRCDTLHLQLTDRKGRSLGSGIGLYQHSFPMPTLPLAARDTLHVALHHFMQRSPLTGITDVGLTLNSR